jgi:hypothetical protein
MIYKKHTSLLSVKMGTNTSNYGKIDIFERMYQHTRLIDSSLKGNGKKEKSKRGRPKGGKSSEDRNTGRKSNLSIEEPNQALF